MKKNFKKVICFLIFAMATFSLTYANVEGSIQKPKYVFMFIGDGLGASQRQISEYYLQYVTNDPTKKLFMNSFNTSGLNTTHSADSIITDSAAAGTALATGFKTNNGVISMKPDGTSLETLIEMAEKANLATGIVTSTRLTHATPATFASHNINRNNENEIAEDFLDSGVDFFAGGGLRHFIPKNYPQDQKDYSKNLIKSKRKDNKNLIKDFEKKGYETYIGKKGTDEFINKNFVNEQKVFASFTYSHMPYEIDRLNQYSKLPSLSKITSKAIDCLEENEEGFFLMVEGGRIDHAAHANDAASTIHDVLAFDRSIKKAYDFYEKHPKETLILVVGDHETGGLGLGMDTKGYFVDLKPLTKAKASIADEVLYGKGKYSGNKDKFLNYAKETFGIQEFTDKELKKLNAAMIDSDNSKKYGYYNYDPAGIALTHIISERANIFWTTTIHTGTAIPMSAVGNSSEKFSGYKDNTEISKTMKEILEFKE